MSKLPQTDELPHADEGFDPARVEEAFATFADRVRELESVASELRAELHSLRAERTAPGRFDDEDWPVERRLQAGGPPSADWVASRAAAARPRLRRCRGSRSKARSCCWSPSSPASPTSPPSGSCS